MDINQIEAYLSDADFQQRLKALIELRNYEADVAVPLLLSKVQDREFLVRSFVAMGLGRKRTAESFAALLEMMKFDRDPNVRAEASNSLSLFGEISAPHLLSLFLQDDHWLVRRSILAAMTELNSPEELYEICACGLTSDDETVRTSSTDVLALLAGTGKQDAALKLLLSKVSDPSWRIRFRVAKSLAKFNTPEAQDALKYLRQDEDHRVVGAVLESLL
jgi:HEAT repeat protein